MCVECASEMRFALCRNNRNRFPFISVVAPLSCGSMHSATASPLLCNVCSTACPTVWGRFSHCRSCSGSGSGSFLFAFWLRCSFYFICIFLFCKWILSIGICANLLLCLFLGFRLQEKAKCEMRKRISNCIAVRIMPSSECCKGYKRLYR